MPEETEENKGGETLKDIVVEYNNPIQTLQDIFDSYGSKVKKEAATHQLFYDFDPYNSKEPILLAI